MEKEIIKRTREWFANNQLACMAEAASGQVRVNDLQSYCRECEANIKAIFAGEWDHTFTFWQRAHFIQTGESVPLLHKVEQ